MDNALAATTTKTGGTVLQLADLHGDITLQLPADTIVAPTVLDADEYGNARTGQPTARYAWLGGKQRSDETVTGLTLMGIRLYDPTIGRFLSTDPVPGGSSNAYDYANQDPLNGLDLDGRTARGNQRSSEFKDWSDAQLEHFYRQPSTPKAMKQKIKKEQKARGSRGSRSSNSKKSQGRNNRQHHHHHHHHYRTYAKWGLGGAGVAAGGAACFFGGCEIAAAVFGFGALTSWGFSW